MKKNKKTIQDNTNSTKVIPPYPRWVKICFALVWVLLIVFSLLVGVVEIEDSITVGLAFGLFLLTLSVVFGYGVYHSFRYFTKSAFYVLALLVIVGVSILLLPAWFRQRFLKIFFDSRSIIFLVLGGLIVGQAIFALFWKKARNFGWLISYTVLFVILAITGQIYDYVTRDPIRDYIIPVGVQVGPGPDCIRPDCSYVYSYEIEKLTEYKNENPTEYKKQTKKLFIR